MTETIFRVAIVAILLTSITVSGYYRSRARAAGGQISRRAEGGWFLLLRLLIALPLFGSVLLYVVAPQRLEWASLPLPPAARWLGLGLGVLVPFAVLWVFRSIGDNISETVLTKDRQTLVTDGPYRWVRHPLYTTGIALFVALGLMAANVLILGMALVALILIFAVVIPREEDQLVARFGDHYRAYRRRTGRLLPRPWR